MNTTPGWLLLRQSRIRAADLTAIGDPFNRQCFSGLKTEMCNIFFDIRDELFLIAALPAMNKILLIRWGIGRFLLGRISRASEPDIEFN